jgi:hypothetical protein
MYAPSKSSFRRSSERDVAGRQAQAAEKHYALAEKDQLERDAEFERLSMGLPLNYSGLVSSVQLEARRYSCRTEDESTFEADGWVR